MLRPLSVPCRAAALCLGLASHPLAADEARAPEPVHTAQAGTAASRVPVDGAAMRIFIVEWKIRKGREQEFLDYWSKRATVADRTGLVGDYLATPETVEQWPWLQWPTPIDRADYSVYYNISLWRDAASFQEQVGRFIAADRPPLDFEAERRSRVMLGPQRWRAGAAGGPARDSDQTR